MKKITVIGANPAWQKTLEFSRFAVGEVNRAVSSCEFASGKGINFCRAAGIWQVARAEVIQFVGGRNGELITQKASEEGLVCRGVATRAPSRCCITCLDREHALTTECIEPSFAAEKEEIARFVAETEQSLTDAALAAICGTLPGGTDPIVYAQIADLARIRKLPILLDAIKNTESVFATAPEIWLKINRQELSELSGEETPEAGLRRLFARFGNLRYAGITSGPDTAYFSDGVDIIRYEQPKLPPRQIVSTLGCGDTASAVFGSELLNGTAPAEAFRLALGAASANCLTLKCGEFSPIQARDLADQTTLSGCR